MRAETTIETRDGVYWVAGSRVSLDSVVYEFLDGQTAESIAQSFPTLSLEQVYSWQTLESCIYRFSTIWSDGSRRLLPPPPHDDHTHDRRRHEEWHNHDGEPDD